MTQRWIATCLLTGMLVGCSSVSVIKDPGPEDRGIRFYRPKPYLLVTPADATGRMVKLKIEYLPDYSEEYSVHPQGKKPPQVQLKDGWNLVAVGGSAPPEKPEEAPPPAAPVDPMKVPEYVVAAGNVPIGLYEAVFDTKCGGKKYLKGWRYVGFSVLGGGSPIGTDPSCAHHAGGVGRGSPNRCLLGGRADGSMPGGPPDGSMACGPAPGASSSIPGPLYGLVFFNGVMTFRQLDEIANNMTCPQYLKPIPEPVKAVGAPPGAETRPVGRPPGAETTPEVKPRPGGTEIKPEKPAETPRTPATPAPNPPPSANSRNGTKPAAASEDSKVTRTSTASKIPSPRNWGFTK